MLPGRGQEFETEGQPTQEFELIEKNLKVRVQEIKGLNRDFSKGNEGDRVQHPDLLCLLPVYKGLLKDLIYIPQLNCYLLDYDYHFYRKNIDQKPPAPFMDVNSDSQGVVSFRNSNLHQRLIMVKDGFSLVIVNLKIKKIEMKVKADRSTPLTDLRLFSPNENMICCLDVKGSVSLCSLKFDLKKICAQSEYQIELLSLK